MTKINILKLRKVYKILLSVSIILAAVCLIIGSVYIYLSGNGYSRDVVITVFSKINIPIYLCLIFIVIDIIWEFLSPSAKKNKKLKIKKSPKILQRNVNPINVIVLSIAIIALVFGAIFGGYLDVLTKAVNICTECIGLG